MSRPYKRTYTSNLRANQAEATRQAILDAARRVCCVGGWPNATIQAIAKEAGVSKETIYAVFGSKVVLIGEMVMASVAKSVPGKHFLDDERPRAISAERNLARQIELWVTYITEIIERVSPLLAIVRSGSDVEPEMGDLYRAIHKQRKADLRVVAKSIFDHRKLPKCHSIETTTELLWQLASPEMFHLLTAVGGYSTDRYAEWLTGMLKTALLGSKAR